MIAEQDERKDGVVPEPPITLGEITEFIRVAAEHMREYGLSSVEVEQTGTRIRLRSGASSMKTASPESTSAHLAVSAPVAHDEEGDDGEFITAPMIGTYYAAPGPGEPVFVEAGDEIEAGQTIAIIEAMKIMNEIAADRAGIVLEVLVRNAQAVEYGQPLLRIAPLQDE
jgi:acetyl-CoA carboxylase biotin carboxyl carrier protein